MIATTFNVILLAVTDALGNDSSKATAWATRGINYAYLLTALLFLPTELQKSTSLTLTAAASTVDLSSLTSLRLIDSLYNATSSRKMFPLSWEKWHILKPTVAGNALFYSRRNVTLYTAPPPAVDNTLTCYYTDYPSLLASGDTLGIANHDPFIVSTALKFAWAFQEEKEVSDLFGIVEESLKLPFLTNAIMRKQFEEGAKRG